MGLVKFGQQTLSIDAIPDGHVVISESEIANMRSAHNALLLIKSKIPAGVDETQLSSLLEKGLKFDTLNQEVLASKAKLEEVNGKLNTFANIPAEFSVEKWNNFTKKEQAEIRNKKISDLTSKVYEKAKAELKLQDISKIQVDPRFVDQNKMQNFNPDSPTAQDELQAILEEGQKAQLEFIKNAAGTSNTTIGNTASPFTPALDAGGTADEGGIKIGGLGLQ